MNLQYKNWLMVAVTFCAFLLTSCNNDDQDAIDANEIGSINLEFDNVYNNADFSFNTNYTNSNGEVVKFTNAKYIVSNVILTKEDGTTFEIPKNESYFIVNEEDASSREILLTNIPAGNYSKVTFGIGVDQEKFNTGETGQGNFITTAQTEGMLWSWSAGYKFLSLEGTFTTPSITSATQFRVHTGQTSTSYNYTTVTLDFPDKALVRKTITPDVHIFADLAKAIDGTNKINFTEGADVMFGAKLALITTNLSSVFSVDHVHND
jgi:hypothetical protein